MDYGKLIKVLLKDKKRVIWLRPNNAEEFYYYLKRYGVSSIQQWAENSEHWIGFAQVRPTHDKAFWGLKLTVM